MMQFMETLLERRIPPHRNLLVAGPARPARAVTAPLCLAELSVTMQPAPDGHDWGDTLYPLAGDTVVAADGSIGCAMHTCFGRPLLPPGGMHRYVISDHDDEPTIAWHISQLRPFDLATEIH